MKITLIDSISAPGSAIKANEDLFLVAEDLCVVLDGATGLGDQVIYSHSSDAVWFVETIAARLVQSWTDNRDFIQALLNAIDSSIGEYATLTKGRKRSAFELPSAGMAAVAIEEGKINAYRLGDCSGYCGRRRFAYQIFGNSPLESLDAKAISKMALEIHQGKTLQEARRAILPMLRLHRAMMNKPEGYGALSLSRDCLQYIETESIYATSKPLILLATDGFSAIEDYVGYTPAGIFDRAKSLGLARMVNEIREIENADTELKKHPRLKPHDDATAVLFRLSA